MTRLVTAGLLRADGSFALVRLTLGDALVSAQRAIGASMVEPVHCPDGAVLLVDEDGLARARARNHAASQMAGRLLVGDALALTAEDWQDPPDDDAEPVRVPLARPLTTEELARIAGGAPVLHVHEALSGNTPTRIASAARSLAELAYKVGDTCTSFDEEDEELLRDLSSQAVALRDLLGPASAPRPVHELLSVLEQRDAFRAALVRIAQGSGAGHGDPGDDLPAIARAALGGAA